MVTKAGLECNNTFYTEAYKYGTAVKYKPLHKKQEIEPSKEYSYCTTLPLIIIMLVNNEWTNKNCACDVQYPLHEVTVISKISPTLYIS
jgi:hypothetical protein